ncbi:MAG TPA: bifunctional metallophosphatase/5'-nucleotidase [Myxococcales bacterium]|nr:bifunctional metallophosphatase/5'-nucleotidase [Myxococcales bacterium]
MDLRRYLLTSALAGLAACTVSETQPNLAGQDVRLTVFHTADIHSRLLPYDITIDSTDRGLGMYPEAYPFGGAARIRALYLQQKQLAARSVLLDSGDAFEGAPIFNENNGEPEFRFMSLLHPDASCVGNHEFDHGAENFAEQAKAWVNYPLLVSNYLWQPWTDPVETQLGEITRPFTIVNADGLRLGIIGMGNLDSLTGLTQGSGNSLGAIALETNETAREYVNLLAPMVDMVVILSHLGLTDDQNMITGYDDYYPYQSAKPFLACDVLNDPSCTAASGCCRDYATDQPWMIENVLPPRDQTETDDSCQLQPGESLNADGSCPAGDFIDLAKLNPNRRVHVFIPPVQNIDLIMGGHIHVVLLPTAVITELTVDRQNALSSPSPNGNFSGCPPNTVGYENADGSLSTVPFIKPTKDFAVSACYSGGLWPDGTYHLNKDASDVFGAVPNLTKHDGTPAIWNCPTPDAPTCAPREVLIQHSGAFAKYLGRLDLVVRMPPTAAQAQQQGLTQTQIDLRNGVGGEIVAHNYVPLPIDAAWCLQPRPVRDPYDPSFAQFEATVENARVTCAQQEDLETLQLLEPYTENLNQTLELPAISSYAPNEILRFSQGAGEDAALNENSSLAGSVGGDSELGDAMAESMRIYQGVEAEFALTNTLGLRDNIYQGPINLETLFNVFPFEDFLTIQYLSGTELQYLLDFVTDVSASRGCSSEAQVAGLQFVQDCGRSIRNSAPSCDELLANGARPEPCVPSCQQTSDCLNAAQQYPDSPSAQWYSQTCAGQETPYSPANTGCECVQGSCYAWTAHDISVNGQELDLSAQYKGVVNNYIAQGGSGYHVLQANTSKITTSISLRNSLLVYLRDNFCQCPQILAGNPECARYHEGDQLVIDPAAVTYCTAAQSLESYVGNLATEYGMSNEQVVQAHPERMIAAPNGVWAGQCECRQVLAAQIDPDPNCGHVTNDLRQFCLHPTQVSVVTAQEDGRIVLSTQ